MLLETSLRKILSSSSAAIICRPCVLEGESANPGTFSLNEPLDSNSECCHGHKLPAEDYQFYAGVNKDFQTFACPANTEIKILSGTMKISCKENPLTVRARICNFETFGQISSYLSEQNEVMIL